MKLSIKVTLVVAGAVTVGAVAAAGVAGAFGGGHAEPAANRWQAAPGGPEQQRDTSLFAGGDQAPSSGASAGASAATTATGARLGATLHPGAALVAGQFLAAPSGKYRLLMQADGNLVEYDAAKKAVWSSQTGNHPGASVRFGSDGDVLLSAASGSPLWHSATAGAGAVLQVQDDGNVVVYSAAKKGVWASAQEKFQLYPNQGLLPGQTRTSPDGRYLLAQQADGNLVEYDAAKKAVWSSQTGGNPGAYTFLGPDGNLVTYSAKGTPLYATATAHSTGAALQVQNDGNAVLYTPAKKAVWGSLSTGVSKLIPGERLSAGQSRTSPNGKYLLVQQADGNLVEYDAAKKAVWSSGTGGNPGAFSQLQTDGNLVTYSAAGKALWSSATGGKSVGSLLVQDDGNVVLYSPSDQAVWSRSG